MDTRVQKFLEPLGVVIMVTAVSMIAILTSSECHYDGQYITSEVKPQVNLIWHRQKSSKCSAAEIVQSVAQPRALNLACMLAKENSDVRRHCGRNYISAQAPDCTSSLMLCTCTVQRHHLMIDHAPCTMHHAPCTMTHHMYSTEKVQLRALAKKTSTQWNFVSTDSQYTSRPLLSGKTDSVKS